MVPTPVPNFNGQHSVVRFCFMGDNIVLFFRGSQMHMKLKAGESVVEQHKPLLLFVQFVNFITRTKHIFCFIGGKQDGLMALL